MGLCSRNGMAIVHVLLVEHHLVLVEFEHLCLVVADFELVVVVLERVDVIAVLIFLRLLFLHLLLIHDIYVVFRHLLVFLLNVLLVFGLHLFLEFFLLNFCLTHELVAGLALRWYVLLLQLHLYPLLLFNRHHLISLWIVILMYLFWLTIFLSRCLNSQSIQHFASDIVLLIVSMWLISCNKRVISVLDHMLSSPVAEGYLHFGPFFTSPLQHIFKNNDVLPRLPISLYFCGIQVVMPSFPTMFGGDKFLSVSLNEDVHGYLSPFLLGKLP